MDAAQKTHNPFVICRAAAGSGKTFTLVKEYLKLAMAAPSAVVRRDREALERQLRRQFAGILAITFTNKAAGEMKGRVMEYLEQMAEYGADPSRSRMGRPLMDALNALPAYDGSPVDEAELRWMAATVHSAVLHQYSDLSVCTIDSFMHRVVRTFAHDLNRPVNFEVMLDQDEMIEQAVAQLMAQVGTPGSEELTRVVQAYADSRMEDAKGYNIEGDVSRLARQLFKEGTDEYLALLKDMTISDFIDLQRQLTAANRRFEQAATDCGAAVMALLERHGVGEGDCAGGRNGYYGFFRGLAGGNVRPLTATVANTFESGKLHSAKCAEATMETIGDMMDELYPLYEKARRMLGVADGRTPDEGADLRDYSTRAILAKNLYTMALLHQLKRQLDIYCQAHEVVHLSEFNQLINSIVSDEPAPFIYERLGNRYHHFLIDEFQDTSVLQWHNLVPLLENGVSQHYESLVVGDGKQAIYRFRQGDVRQFVALPRVEGMAHHGAALSAEGNYSHVPLSTNYRTASSVVNFNNAFFTWLLQREPFASNALAQQIYVTPVDSDGHPALWQQLPSRGVPQGHVGVSFVDDGDADAVNEQVRQTIVRLVTEQGYRQRDIMVLGRSNKELDSVSTYLQSHSEELRVEVSSSESFFLVRSHAVMAVVAALRLLNDPTDRVAAADLLQRLFHLGLVTDCHRDAFLEAGPIDVARLLREEQRGFDFRPDYLTALDLYDCCEELVRELHLDGIDTAYVGSLLGRVSAFASRYHQGVDAFLEWFDTNASADLADGKHKQLSAASPEGVDAVRLLTIHKAKGLEAPVVICPLQPAASHGYNLWVKLDGQDRVAGKLPAAFVELNREGTSRFDGVRDHERRLEEVDVLNVLYVALTRPKEQLFVICPTPAKSSKDELSYPRMIKEFMDGDHPDLGEVDCRHEARPESTGVGRDEVALHRLSFAEWSTKVQVASTAERALSPMQEESVRLGNLVHDMMAHVRSAADVEAAAMRMAADGAVDESMRQQLLEVGRRVVTHADAERFFREGYDVKTECDLCDSDGLCRPDRVVVTGDETWVVDFKTGRDLGEEHNRQVRRYCQAMREMGYPQVSGWLLYLMPEVRVRRVI